MLLPCRVSGASRLSRESRDSKFAFTGFNYSTELDIYADGYSLRLVDPYNAPVLYFRRPGDDHEEVVRYGNDDPFFSEVVRIFFIHKRA